jgi:hypothetical protein
MPNLISFPTLQAECHDTEARSLKKLCDIQYETLGSITSLSKPGGAAVGPTAYVYGNAYTVPQGADLLDIACYNQQNSDVWVFLILAPSATGPQPGMNPTFPIHVYAHNHAYYEAMASALSVPSGQQFFIAVSTTETSLTWATAVYLAIRHN